MHPYHLSEVQLVDSSDTSNLDAPLCNYIFNNNTGYLYLYTGQFLFPRVYRFIYMELIRVQLRFKSETVSIVRWNKSERKEKIVRKKKIDWNWQRMKFITQVRNIYLFFL